MIASPLRFICIHLAAIRDHVAAIWFCIEHSWIGDLLGVVLLVCIAVALFSMGGPVR